MPQLSRLFACVITSLLAGCAIQAPVTHQYQLASFSPERLSKTPQAVSLLLSQPEAVAGYQTEQMLYIKTPYQLHAFANNAWVSAPANMLFPLMIQSLQQSAYFYAVATAPYGDKADYRLDTQLIKLDQNFLVKPSEINLSVKFVLTQVENNQVIASTIIHERMPCSIDTPYGGVLAANQATRQLTQKVTHFVIKHVKARRRALAKN